RSVFGNRKVTAKSILDNDVRFTIAIEVASGNVYSGINCTGSKETNGSTKINISGCTDILRNPKVGSGRAISMLPDQVNQPITIQVDHLGGNTRIYKPWPQLHGFKRNGSC